MECNSGVFVLGFFCIFGDVDDVILNKAFNLRYNDQRTKKSIHFI